MHRLLMTVALLGALSTPAAADNNWSGGFAEYPVLSERQTAQTRNTSSSLSHSAGLEWMNGHAEYPVLTAPLTRPSTQLKVDPQDAGAELDRLRQIRGQHPALSSDYREGGSSDADAIRRAEELVGQGAFDEARGYLELLRQRLAS